jgi:hypothetical protein
MIGNSEMNNDRRKYVWRELDQRLRNAWRDREKFATMLQEFRKSPIEMRRDVAAGVLAVASDRSEQLFNRWTCLQFLLMNLSAFDLGGDANSRECLEEIIDDPLLDCVAPAGGSNDSGSQQSGCCPLGASRTEKGMRGLSNLGELIASCGDSELGRDLRQLREQFLLEAGGKCGADPGGSPPGKDPSSTEAWEVRRSALNALLALDRVSGLRKLDQLLVRFDQGECGRQLRELRERFSHDSGDHK